jgi:acetyltransferase
MSTYRLDRLFAPRSIAVVGGSPRATSPGGAVLRNLHAAGFPGTITLVNPHYPDIEGVRSVPTVQELPEAPDLVVIAAPPPSVPAIIAAAGEKGAAAAIIISAGSDMGRARWPRPARKRRAGAACDWWGRIASACWRRTLRSMPVSPPAPRLPATSR